MANLSLYPWQKNSWQRLQLQREKLPHALLFTGMAGIGKGRFVELLAYSLLCAQPIADTYLNCGQCQHCRLLSSDNHPDLLLIKPLAGEKALGIEAIRGVVKFAQLTAQLAKCRCVIIQQPEAMQVPAANALLKILEEPLPGVYLLLHTAYPSQLLATIRSRCQTVLLPVPKRQLVAEWLSGQSLPSTDYKVVISVARGAPLTALALSQSPLWQSRCQVVDVLLADRKYLLSALPVLMAVEIFTLLLWWLGLANDLTKLALEPALSADFLAHVDYYDRLYTRSQQLNVLAFIQFIDTLQHNTALLSRQVPLNQQLVIENLFITWSSLMS